MKKLFFLFVNLILPFLLIAQNPEWLNYNNGGWVSCFAENSQYTYSGTFTSGLVQINKFTNQTTIFNKANSNIQSNVITDLEFDNQGNLWIGSDIGLNKFTGTNFALYTLPNSWDYENFIYGMTMDHIGNLWIVYNQVGLVKFDMNANWQKYYYSNFSDYCSDLRDIVVDKQNKIWAIFDDEVILFDNGSWYYQYNSNTNSNLPTGDFTGLAVDSFGDIWLSATHTGPYSGTSGVGGISLYQNGVWHTVSTNENYNDIFIDKNNIKWFIYDSNKIKKYGPIGPATIQITPSNNLRSIYIDNSNNIWAGTQFDGIYKFDNINWTNYSAANSNVPYNRISGLYIDKNDNKYISTHYGTVKFDNSNWTSITIPNWPGLSIGQNSKIDSSGVLWISNAGLVKIEDSVFTRFSPPSSSFVNSFELEIGPDGWIYLTTDNLIYKFNGSAWDSIPNPAGVSCNPTTIEFDNSGKLWVGFHGCGIAYYYNNVWTTFGTGGILSNTNVTSIISDKTGKLWFGTMLDGLYCLNNGNWTIYNKNNSGIRTNEIMYMVMDSSETLYTSGYYSPGISIFNGTFWDSITVNNSALPNSNINNINLDKHGNLWIGTENGLAVYKKGGIIFVGQTDEIDYQIAHYSVFPNPSNGVFYLRFENSISNKTKVDIYDFSGKLLESKYIYSNDDKLDLSGYPKGIYCLKLNLLDRIETKKVIIN